MGIQSRTVILTMFLVIIVLASCKMTASFRIELDNTLFHIEAQQRPCGCDEKTSLDTLKSKEWMPEHFMTADHGKLWLGGIKGQEYSACANLCLLVNQRTSHFTFEGDEMCHCYSDLHPFHCEEEEGVDLVPIHCLDQKKVPNSRPLLTLLSRLSPPPRPATPKSSINLFKSLENNRRATLAAASLVLIILALGGLVCLMGKTYYDNRKKRKMMNNQR